jgi:hypothetical protein
MGDEGELGLEPWEHHPGEHPRNYHVFEIFCHLGWDRSVRKAAEKWYAETGHDVPKNPGQRFNLVAIRDRWQERADCYWRQERRRVEHLLQAKRDHIDERIAAIGGRTLEKLARDVEKRFGTVLAASDVSPKVIAETLPKLREVLHAALGDTDDRKRRGRPSEDAGALPAVEDRLKPPDAQEEPNG